MAKPQPPKLQLPKVDPPPIVEEVVDEVVNVTPETEEAKVDQPQDAPTELDEPQIPTPEEEPNVPDAPAATDPTAVETTASGKKFGWQQAPVRKTAPVEDCFHMGLVQARRQIANQDVGHEWVCTCGTEFEVTMNSSGKKILKPKEV
jgi:hypothetical protein